MRVSSAEHGRRAFFYLAELDFVPSLDVVLSDVEDDGTSKGHVDLSSYVL